VRRRHAGGVDLELDAAAVADHRHPAAGADLPRGAEPPDAAVGGALSMIRDAHALENLRQSWNGVGLLRSKIQGALLGSFAMGSPFALSIANAAHNLPFLQACAVLNDVLAQLRDEQHFRCGRLGNDRTPLGVAAR